MLDLANTVNRNMKKLSIALSLLLSLGFLSCTVLPQANTSQGASKALRRFSADALVGGWISTNTNGLSAVMMLHADGSWATVDLGGSITNPTLLKNRSSGAKWELIARPRTNWGTSTKYMALRQAVEAGQPGAGWILKCYFENDNPSEKIILRYSKNELDFALGGRNQYTRISAEALTGLALFHARKPIVVREINNFHMVAPGVLRGAQPEDQALAELKGLANVQTVLNLRDEKNLIAQEKATVEALGMRYVSIPMDGAKMQDPGKIDAALAIMAGPGQQPVFVHCAMGKDRTGLVLAAYRIKYQSWQVDNAIQEMLLYGYDRGCCSNLETSLKNWAALNTEKK
jgi:protein-tyrosine phosphatase